MLFSMLVIKLSLIKIFMKFLFTALYTGTSLDFWLFYGFFVTEIGEGTSIVTSSDSRYLLRVP